MAAPASSWKSSNRGVMTRTRTILVLVAVAAVSVGATLLTIEIQSEEAPVEGALTLTMRSAILVAEREVSIHLPEGYGSGPSRRYPVLYVLDGTSQSGHTAASAALLARVGMIPPMIVVGVPSVDGETRNRDFTPPHMRIDNDVPDAPNGSADRFLAHLERELIPEIERRYRTARPRMLSGWSRGGLFVVYAEMERPVVFDAVFAHSPALWRQEDRIVRQLEQSFSGARPPAGFVFLSLGDDENPKMSAGYRHAMDVLGRHAPSTLRWKGYRSVGGTHESNPRLSMPVGLCAMFRPNDGCGL